MEMFKQIQESLMARLQSLYEIVKGATTKEETDEALVRQAESDEEKKLIRETCTEIDMEHDLMEELVASDKDAGQWMNEKIEETAREIKEDATQEEIDSLKEAVVDSMEAEIGEQADELASEGALIAQGMTSVSINNEVK